MIKIYCVWGERAAEHEKNLQHALRRYLRERDSEGKCLPGSDHASELAIERDSRGKPFLPEHPEIVFSVTHTGGWWLCATGDAAWGSLGLDAERKARAVKNPVSAARRFFSPAEAEYIISASKPEAGAAGTDTAQPEKSARIGAADRFLQIWVRKEAWLKYTGEGLAGGMNKTTVTLCQTDSVTESGDGVAEEDSVEFVPLDISDEIYAVLCRRKTVENLFPHDAGSEAEGVFSCFENDRRDREIEICWMM